MHETSSGKEQVTVWENQRYEAPISHSNAMQSLPLHLRPTPHHEEAEGGATQRQNAKGEYQKLGFQTSHGLEWFTLSPETLVRCLIDSELYMLRSAPTDNIDYEAVLGTNTFIIDLEEQTPVDFDSKSLLEAVDTAVEEGVRQRSMIRRVIKDMLEQRHGVSNFVLEKAEALLDNQIRELRVKVPEKWNPKSLAIKACVVAKYMLLSQLKQKPRIEGEEFHLALQRISGANCDNILTTDLFLPYDVPFYNLLATLREKTMIPQKPTPTSDEVLSRALDGGPWMYRLVRPSEALGEWLSLSDEVEYHTVLQSLRKGEGDLVLMHKVEVDMVARYQEEQDKTHREWDEGESDDLLIDQSGDVVVFDPQDNIPSAASSPSVAYSGLSIEGERGGETGVGGGPQNSGSQGNRSQSPNKSFIQRAMMGGAADIPLRSSSPLKRPASELEQENPAKDKEDVDMEGIEISKEVPDSSNQGPDANGNGETQISQLQEPASQDTDTSLPEADGEMSEDVPPIDEQIRRVKELHEAFESQPLTPGTKTYIISNTWLDNVQAHASGAKLSNAEPVGPVDNADIVYEILTDQNQQPFARLKHEVVGGSVAYFPEAAWNLVVQWHGLKAGQVPIIRQAVDTSMDPEVPNVQFELHPVVFKIHRLWAVSSPLPISQILKAKNPPAPIFIMSRNDRFQDFLKSIKKSANIETQQTVRVWTVPIFSDEKTAAAAPAGGASPPLSRAGTPAPDAKSAEDWTKLLVEAATFNGLTRGAQREIVDTKDYTNDPKYNGRSTIAMTGLGKDQALVLDELIEGNTYLATYAQKVAKQGTKGIATGSANMNRATAVSRPDSGRSSPAPSVPMTRGRVQKSSGKTVGTVGLANLGNTCYMNSALQCIRSVEELTKYFLADEAEKELNTENPLGKGGNVALVYNALLRELYKEPPPSSITPRQFKNTFGRYFGSFSGYGQQDSQEFLGILLDALQEDLNRVKKKPYIEKPDSTDEMVDNPAALKKMAKEVWDITKRRDDSVIGDLFTGMYKSTLVCPDCAKVSITFDPFSTVTMQLPIESTWGHEVFFFPLNDKPVRVAVDMDKQGSIKGLKTFVSSRVDVPVERLFIAEEFNNQIYRILEDTKSVSEDIQANDRIMVFELEAVPTNWPPVRKPKQKTRSMLNVSYSYQDDDEGDIPSWDSPRAERMIVPVISRRQNPNPTRFGKPLMHAYAPFFITLTPEEARSEDIIQRKILERVANLTTYNMSGYETDDDQSAEQDIVITTASDTSSGDGKVVATSIDGEDDVVDVTVTEQNNRPAEVDGQKDSNPRKRKFQSRRPKWIDPEQFLPSEYNNLFELSYFSSKKEVVPTGWGVVDEEKLYPRLSSRIPVVQDAVEVDDEASDGFASNNPQRSDGESSEDDIGDIPQLAPTRMNEESSDDDDLAPNTRVLPVRPIAQHAVYKVGQMKAFRRGIRTYSRKGNKRTPQRARMSSEEVEEDANPGPLVRLGEGIVVDWYQDPFATLFEGDQEDTMRGRECWSSVGLLEDPVLEAKRKSRLRRRSKGLSLDECLDEFGKEEILSEMDTWYCPRCKEHRRASKKLELWRTPDIMVFHLKRFSSTAMRRDKLDIQVTFPIDGLDMSTRVLESEDGKKDIYDLFAVDNHYGSLGGGHYTAYAKSFVDGAWYDYNDSAVSKLKDPSHVISSAAYLLFYRRRSDRPLGGQRFEEILARFDNPPATSEDESSGSGEGQRLGADSSLRGSPSALTGVEATRQAGHGSVTGTTAGTTVATRSVTNTSIVPPSAIDSPPDYKDALEDDGAPLLERDAIMNDGIEMRDASGDEAIDLGSAYDGDFPGARVGGMEPNWNFSALAQPYSHNNYPASATSVELGSVGARSDDVQHDSSASEGSMAGRLADFDAADVDEDYVDQDPVPDLDEDQVDLLSLHGELGDMQARRRYEEVVPEVPGSEGEAAEIHVHEGEGVN
ncbi:hypothetical protein V499_06329 [Pseudogymnoascus sp. VKM F-103]|nr:hypothetical protein V499_06329 [Pseudogymnoascus sp. VKM F-103]